MILLVVRRCTAPRLFNCRNCCWHLSAKGTTTQRSRDRLATVSKHRCIGDDDDDDDDNNEYNDDNVGGAVGNGDDDLEWRLPARFIASFSRNVLSCPFIGTD